MTPIFLPSEFPKSYGRKRAAVCLVADLKEGEERWFELCAQAAVEQDPKRLLELVSEICRLLEEGVQPVYDRYPAPLRTMASNITRLHSAGT
jgi:hypothetical protein